MNPKQRRFVAEYLKDQNGTQAAIRAGYSKKTARFQACDLLTKPNIKASIDAALAEVAAKAGVTAEYVLEGLKEVAQRCMQRHMVMEFDKAERCMVQATAMTDDGREIGLWEFDSAGANRALELLGRHLKMFTDKVEITDDTDKAKILRDRRAKLKH